MGVRRRNVEPPITGQGLFVGVDEYENLPSLTGCANNAALLADAFGSVLTDTVVLTDDMATRSAILGTLETMITTLGDRDILVLFIASHGVERHGDFNVLPHDTEEQAILRTGFQFGVVTSALSQAKCRSLIILDACHSGGVGFDLSKYRDSEGCGIMMACRPDELSREHRTGEQVNGMFTFSFAEALRRGKQEVTLGDVFDEAYDETKRLSGNQQHPVFVGTLPHSLVVI